MKRALIDKDGWPVAFFEPDSVHDSEAAISLSDDDWVDLVNNQGTRKYINDQVVIAPQKVEPLTAEQQAELLSRDAVQKDTILTGLKSSTPDQAYAMVMQADPTEFKTIVASLAKYIAWRHND